MAASIPQAKKSKTRTYTYVKRSTTQGNMATPKGHYASGFKAKARVQCVQRNRDKHRHAHCNNMVVQSTYIQRNLHAQQSATLKTILANSPAATMAAIAQDSTNKATTLKHSYHWRREERGDFVTHSAYRAIRPRSKVPLRRAMQLVDKSVYRRQISSACSVQRPQVATKAHCAQCSTQAKTTIG